MTAQSGAVMQREEKRNLVEQNDEQISNQISQMYELVARRAFEIFETRGRSFGYDKEDWALAEAELLRPVSLSLTELPERYRVHAEVPDFFAGNIRISVEPRRLLISGRRDLLGQESNAAAVRLESKPNRIFCTLELASEIETSQVRGYLKDGILTVDLPKVHGG